MYLKQKSCKKRLLEVPFSFILNTSRDEHNSSGQLGPVFYHNTWKIFLLTSNPDLLSFHFKPLPLDLSLQSLVKISLLLFMLRGCSNICPEPAFPQTGKSKVPHPFSMGEVFQAHECLCGPPLAFFHQVHVCLVLRASEGDTALQVGSHKSRVERENCLPQPAGQPLPQPADQSNDVISSVKALLFLSCSR